MRRIVSGWLMGDKQMIDNCRAKMLGLLRREACCEAVNRTFDAMLPMVRDCPTLRGPKRACTDLVGKRLSAFKRGYNDRRWLATRRRILARDGMRCQDCGGMVFNKHEAHVDHIVPKGQGGSEDDDNLQTLCQSCHGKKTQAERRVTHERM